MPGDPRIGMAFWREHDAALIQMAAEGKSTSQVAEVLGVTKNAVVGRAYRMGVRWMKSNHMDKRKGRRPEPQPRPWDFPPHGRCVWPLGDPCDPGFHFCSERIAAPGLPYCPEHFGIAYKPAPLRKEAA